MLSSTTTRLPLYKVVALVFCFIQLTSGIPLPQNYWDSHKDQQVQEWTPGTEIPASAIHTKDETVTPSNGPNKKQKCTAANMYCEMTIKGFKDAPDKPDGVHPTKYDLQNQFAEAVANSKTVQNDKSGINGMSKYQSPNQGSLVISGVTDANGRSRVNNIPVGKYNEEISKTQIEAIANKDPNHIQAQRSSQYQLTKENLKKQSKGVQDGSHPVLEHKDQRYSLRDPTPEEVRTRQEKTKKKEEKKNDPGKVKDDAASTVSKDSRSSQLSRQSSFDSVSSVSTVSTVNTQGDDRDHKFAVKVAEKVGKKAQHHAEDAAEHEAQLKGQDRTELYKTRPYGALSDAKLQKQRERENTRIAELPADKKNDPELNKVKPAVDVHHCANHAGKTFSGPCRDHVNSDAPGKNPDFPGYKSKSNYDSQTPPYPQLPQSRPVTPPNLGGNPVDPSKTVTPGRGGQSTIKAGKQRKFESPFHIRERISKLNFGSDKKKDDPDCPPGSASAAGKLRKRSCGSAAGKPKEAPKTDKKLLYSDVAANRAATGPKIDPKKSTPVVPPAATEKKKAEQTGNGTKKNNPPTSRSIAPTSPQSQPAATGGKKQMQTPAAGKPKEVPKTDKKLLYSDVAANRAATGPKIDPKKSTPVVPPAATEKKKAEQTGNGTKKNTPPTSRSIPPTSPQSQPAATGGKKQKQTQQQKSNNVNANVGKKPKATVTPATSTPTTKTKNVNANARGNANPKPTVKPPVTSTTSEPKKKQSGQVSAKTPPAIAPIASTTSKKGSRNKS